MESKNHKVVKNFLTTNEINQIIIWVENLSHSGDDANYHLRELSKDLHGDSFIFDISKTNQTKYITNFQSINGVSYEEVPQFIQSIIDRLSHDLKISKDHVFLQAVDMGKGGKISPHYDASINGYINYKCNISILSDNYIIYIGNESMRIEVGDLYCFEASLYKHWTDEFNSRRIFLSFGFLLPYEILGRNENEPIIRLSKRIEKYFQNKI